MLESIIRFDQSLFLYLNGLHHSSLDPIMLFVSDSWIPTIVLAITFLILGLRHFGKTVFLLAFYTLLATGASDLISSRIFKPGFERLRPCKEEILKPYIYQAGKKCRGGKFGFVSSHAANSFAFAFFMLLIFRNKNKMMYWLMGYAGLVAYSRIYLAKHYPLDLIFGALLGMTISFIMFSFLRRYHNFRN